MHRKRRRFSGAFDAKVGLGAVGDEKTTAEFPPESGAVRKSRV